MISMSSGAYNILWDASAEHEKIFPVKVWTVTV
jgi:hypothetical protein